MNGMSRLDELFNLLEDPHVTQEIKELAAHKLGQLAEDLGTNVPFLVGKIRSLLGDKAWHTRMAAAKALGCIVKHCQQESLLEKCASMSSGASVDPSLTSSSSVSPLFSLQTVCMVQLLAHAQPLLKSGGEEYHYDIGSSVEDVRKRRLLHRYNLLKRLRIDTSIWETEEDEFVKSMLVKLDREDAADKILNDAEDTNAHEDSLAQQSVREATQQKRKAPFVVLQSSPKRQQLMYESCSNNDLIAVLCVELQEKIFDSLWEVRHGSAAALREIFMAMAKQEVISSSVRMWLQELLVRCMIVLALDQYADFSGDAMVAPVRQLCAQVFGMALTQLAENDVVKYLEDINSMIRCDSWHAVCGGLLALKYWIQTRPLDRRLIVERTWESICMALKHSVDDVKILCCEVCLIVSSDIEDVHCDVSFMVHGLIDIVVMEEENPSALSGHAMELLGAFCQGKQIHRVMETCAKQQWLGKVFSYLRHSSEKVRVAAVHFLGIIYLYLDAEDVLNHLFYRLLAERTHSLIPKIQDMWRKVVYNLSSERIIQVSEVFLKSWIKAFAMPTSETVLIPEKIAVQQFVQHCDSYRSKVSMAQALAYVTLLIPKGSEIMIWVVEELRTLLKSTSFNDRYAGSLWIEMWIRLEQLQEREEKLMRLQWLQQEFGVMLWTLLTHANDPDLYRELRDSFERVCKGFDGLCRIFVQHGHRVQPLDLLSNKWKTCTLPEKSYQVVAQIGTLPFSALPLDALDRAQFIRQNVFGLHDIIQNDFDKLTMRLQSQCAMTYIQLLDLPKKFNPAVCALMASIKDEDIEYVQQKVAKGLLAFIKKYIHLKKCISKLIQNVCNSFCSIDPAASVSHTTSLGIRRRGAQMVLLGLATCYSRDIFEKFEVLRTRVLDAIAHFNSDLKMVQDASMILTLIFPALENQSRTKLIGCLPAMLSRLEQLHQVSSRPEMMDEITQSIAVLCAHDVMLYGESWKILYKCLLARNPIPVSLRCATMKIVFQLVEAKGADIVPIVPSLLKVVMALMSDSNENVRKMASGIFSRLISMVSLSLYKDKDEDEDEDKDKDEDDNKQSSSQVLPVKGTTSYVQEMNQKAVHFLRQMLSGNAVKHVEMSHVLTKGHNLRDYQQLGINWLGFLKENGLNGILADDMGLGKTLQTLCSIRGGGGEEEEEEKARSRHPSRRASLVICPATLVDHWVEEAKRYLSGIQATSYASDQDIQKLVETHDIVVTSYHHVRSSTSVLAAIHWYYIVLDEVHVIRNPKTNIFQSILSLSSEHRIALTGTPIQNSIVDLWSIFEFLMPGYLGTHTAFCAKFLKPLRASGMTSAMSLENDQLLKELHGKVLPFILRRTKGEVLKDLPPKIIQDFVCVMGTQQRKLYEKYEVQLEEEMKEKSMGSSSAFQHLSTLRKICIHPALMEEEKRKDGAAFEMDAKTNRPLVALKDSAKFEALLQLLQECGIGRALDHQSVASCHRCLIFVHLKKVLDLIEALLTKHVSLASYLRLDGSVPRRTRMDLVHKFNSDPSIDLLILTTAVGGVGLNLTGADTVIFVEHSWNPFTDLQAMDRVHRLGQTKVVTVYRLICRDTIEEHIMNLQRFKSVVAQTVIDENPTQNSEASTSTTTTTTLLSLLRASSNKLSLNEKKEDRRQLASSKTVSTNGLPLAVQDLLQNLDALEDDTEYDTLQLPLLEK